MDQYSVLIVEDDFVNAHFITQVIDKVGCKVVGCVKNADKAIEIVKNKRVDIVFMDINIEGKKDGICCAKAINDIQKTPIIYTSAYKDSNTIDEASNTNLFGYLIKPFSYYDVEAVLKLTIQQNFKKSALGTTQTEYRSIQDYHYYPKTKTLKYNDQNVALSSRESLLFHHLFIHCQQNVTNEYLEEYVWHDKSVTNAAIRNTVLRLRHKIPNIKIVTVVGIGYRLEECA